MRSPRCPRRTLGAEPAPTRASRSERGPSAASPFPRKLSLSGPGPQCERARTIDKDGRFSSSRPGSDVRPGRALGFAFSRSQPGGWVRISEPGQFARWVPVSARTQADGWVRISLSGRAPSVLCHGSALRLHAFGCRRRGTGSEYRTHGTRHNDGLSRPGANRPGIIIISIPNAPQKEMHSRIDCWDRP